MENQKYKYPCSFDCFRGILILAWKEPSAWLAAMAVTGRARWAHSSWPRSHGGQAIPSPVAVRGARAQLAEGTALHGEAPGPFSFQRLNLPCWCLALGRGPRGLGGAGEPRHSQFMSWRLWDGCRTDPAWPQRGRLWEVVYSDAVAMCAVRLRVVVLL